MLLPGEIIVNRTRSALSSAADRTSRQMGAPVYVQGLTGDKPCILGEFRLACCHSAAGQYR
jgi:hypothetical protein